MHDDPRMTRAADWLISKEVRRKGDWSREAPRHRTLRLGLRIRQRILSRISTTPRMVLLALLHAKASNPKAQAAAERRAINWLLAMQSEDGGWAAFDVDNNWAVLNQVPFADHNAMLDPTCPDITGRVLECLCRRGLAGPRGRAARRGVPAGRAGEGRKLVRPLGRELHLRLVPGDARPGGQRRRPGRAEGDGARRRSGCGRFRMPTAAGANPAPATRATASCRRRVRASQTAWALLGLLAAGDGESAQFGEGVEYLLERQTAGWHVARRGHHRHGLPQRVLPDLRDVSRLLPAAGAVARVA